MREKIIFISKIVGGSIGAVLTIYFIVQWGIPFLIHNEQRVYIWIDLALKAAAAFGILRMYNAVVSNTRFLLSLRETLKMFNKELKNVERSLLKLHTRFTSLEISIKSLNADILRLIARLKNKE